VIQEDRISYLNDKKEQKGKYLVYWMQASQRVKYNHALETALRIANKRSLPLLVYFEINTNYPDANLRHYYFMLEGLQEVKQQLNKMGIKMIISYQNKNSYPDLTYLAQEAAMVITDCGYLRFQTEWREKYAQKLPCPLVQVETDVVVPVESASGKEEINVASFRKKMQRLLADYLKPVEKSDSVRSSLDFKFTSFGIDDIKDSIRQLAIDNSVPPSPVFRGGESRAEDLLNRFITEKAHRFGTLRNDPSQDFLSHMSPYLHFGQISPLYIALKMKAEAPSEAYRVYLDELVIKRELAVNHVFYNDYYDQFRGLPRWAQNTLEKHGQDKRKIVYSLAELEHVLTHDPYWNGAQQEMMITGKMHGNMRRYWAKKILEWSLTPQEAFQHCLYLNNKYALDGRDPNSYTGIAQCFGLHEHVYKERPVFGKVSYMDDSTLRKKYNMEQFLERIKQLKENNSLKKIN